MVRNVVGQMYFDIVNYRSPNNSVMLALFINYMWGRINAVAV